MLDSLLSLLSPLSSLLYLYGVPYLYYWIYSGCVRCVLCMKLTNSILLLETPPPSNTRLFHALWLAARPVHHLIIRCAAPMVLPSFVGAEPSVLLLRKWNYNIIKKNECSVQPSLSFFLFSFLFVFQPPFFLPFCHPCPNSQSPVGIVHKKK